MNVSSEFPVNGIVLANDYNYSGVMQSDISGILKADKTRNVYLIEQEIKKYVCKYKVPLSVIETALRINGCSTYLLAHSIGSDPVHFPKITHPDGRPRHYFLYIVIKDQEKEAEDCFGYTHPSRENLLKLDETGFLDKHEPGETSEFSLFEQISEDNPIQAKACFTDPDVIKLTLQLACAIAYKNIHKDQHH